MIRTGRGLCVGHRRNFVNATLGGSRFVTGYSSVSSIVVFCGSNGCGIIHMASGVFINGGILCIGVFGGGSGHAVCGIICQSKGRKFRCVGQFGVASVAHSHRCSMARNAPNSHVICFATGPGKRTRIVGVALGPGPHVGGVVCRGSFDSVGVGKHRSVNGVLSGCRMRGVTLGRHNNSALNKEGM